jgi:hypothetical protein
MQGVDMELRLVQQTIGLNQVWLEEWIAYRAEDKKKPMTPRAIKMTTKWLMNYPEQEQERLVQHAIMNNWEGLHYVEPPKAVNGRSTRDMSIEECLFDTSWAKQ